MKNLQGQKKYILFRTDASHKIGMGHLMRFYAIAQSMEKVRMYPLFIVRRNKVIENFFSQPEYIINFDKKIKISVSAFSQKIFRILKDHNIRMFLSQRSRKRIDLHGVQRIIATIPQSLLTILR